MEAQRKFTKQQGTLRIVILDQNNLCVDGEHIVRNNLDLGHTTIPVYKRHFKNDAERAYVRQFINYGPKGKPQKDKQSDELAILNEAGMLMELAEVTNHPIDEYQLLLESTDKVDLPDDAIPPKPKSTKIIPGDIYQCGNHFVMCGDSLVKEDVEKLMNGISPRIIFTDPPYDMEIYDYLEHFFETLTDIEVLIMMDDKGTKELILRYAKWFIGFYMITFNSPSRFSNQPMISHRLINHFRKGKSTFQNLRDAFGTVQELVLRKDGLTRHEKPLVFAKSFIVHYSEPGDVILDLFGSSGSTMIACEHSQRICYTMEKDPLIVEVMLKRFEDFTKIKVKKINQS